MKKLVTIIICLAVFVLNQQAKAVVYSYDFSEMGFSDQQNLEGLVLNSAVITSETGALEYHAGHGGGLTAHYGAVADLYIDFSAPITQIFATAGDGAGDDDAFSLYLYEFGTNNFIGRWDTPVFGGTNEPEWYTLSVSAANIGRVVFDPGNSGNLPGNIEGLGGVVLTELCYDVVPEPATMLLISIGGLMAIRKRKNNQ